MKMEIGKTYLVKNDIFSFKKDELCTLVDKGIRLILVNIISYLSMMKKRRYL